MNELANRDEAYRALSTQFHALATVASENVPNYMKRPLSSGVSVVGSAAAGATNAYFGTRTGLAINASVAVGALVAGVFFRSNPDVAELCHATARGLGGGQAALSTYNGVADWIASRPQTKQLGAVAPVV